MFQYPKTLDLHFEKQMVVCSDLHTHLRQNIVLNRGHLKVENI